MELTGHEKSIQDLFCELKREDASRVPAFPGVWNRAEMSHPRSRQEFKVSFAFISAALVVVLFGLALWARNRPQHQGLNPRVAGELKQPNVVLPPATTKSELTETVALAPKMRFKHGRTNRRSIGVRQSELTAMNGNLRETLLISIWHSPTAALMQSPADDLLTSLPQIDQSVAELKSFLPGAPQ